MTFEDYLEMETKSRDPLIKAKSAFMWYEAMEINPDPIDDEDFFEIPTFIRDQASAELYTN